MSMKTAHSTVGIRLTYSERGLLITAAKSRRSKSLSAYIRTVLVDDAKRVLHNARIPMRSVILSTRSKRSAIAFGVA